MYTKVSIGNPLNIANYQSMFIQILNMVNFNELCRYGYMRFDNLLISKKNGRVVLKLISQYNTVDIDGVFPYPYIMNLLGTLYRYGVEGVLIYTKDIINYAHNVNCFSDVSTAYGNVRIENSRSNGGMPRGLDRYGRPDVNYRKNREEIHRVAIFRGVYY